jgi:hypothetical protein
MWNIGRWLDLGERNQERGQDIFMIEGDAKETVGMITEADMVGREEDTETDKGKHLNIYHLNPVNEGHAS